MTEWSVFLVVTTMLGFVGTAYTMFYKPTHNLTIEIVKLNANLEHLNRSDISQNKRLDNHSELIDDHEKRLIVIESTNFIKDRY
ncbi:hypothetical protein G7059_07860 [Erysipelothrix sp. HDW6A]|uniref:hypothetical protein n=1 Tax=Erysipelothrix sp. HDW6A TaxID=2714928 RepID=UPI00140D9A11|nr:hypothetical protein [Erysipelothrix sp. HDW6A]QIK57758.1 hypothetical protein G7059_07860 [Erysipelothrix sp. HDW6A]